MDHIQTHLIERSREYHIPLVLVFVDYRKAFDSVEINAILNALVHAGIPSPYIRLLDDCFSNTSTIIQIGTPGCHETWDDKGDLVDGKRISNLRFADDVVLISTSTAEVEEMLNELNVAGVEIGLDMIMYKTQFMGLDIQRLRTACDVLRDGNLARQQDNRQSNANYASYAGEMSSEDKLSSLRIAGPLTCFDERTIGGVAVSQSGSRVTIRDHWDDRQRDGQTHSQDLSESGVRFTGCKQLEIERSGRVVVSVEKTSSR
ncbi:unnamed protein product [Heligmosomoides polygyrus]|uniref:Reverse transcriptase domain-containing protein n=1 Tax=Heligmosomoides polygyrus TaxID=6339 RepID=A0A183GJE0_HELPZ|nr:unnamed protein product [Heligmosomoides polygyrus]